ncbi:hypothetical protein ACJ2CR_28760 [Myxococcus faecalis]|uniref:hypothetical protein n=1 Tax=Myxococcus faecalis TaxID=3115646 RepID=UPI0038D08456
MWNVSSTKPRLLMKSWRCSLQVAGPPWRTPSAMGPMTSQISCQMTDAGAPSEAGCFMPSTGR